DHIEKAFDFGGMAARNGVTAALLVQAGGTGVDDILSGADNFFQGFVPKNNPRMVVEEMGTRFEIMRTDIKKWTVGAPIQAPLDALDTLIKRERFDASQVKQVVVRVATDEAAIVNDREISDINLQHLIAVMLLDKTVSFKAAHDLARMKDPAVLRERQKVQLVPDAELEKLMPQRTAIVEVTLMDGRTVRERVGTVRGTAANPMTRNEVIGKARDLITPVLGAATFQKLSEMVFALESVKDVNALRPLIERVG
ncbi:MAG TPA: MmgE/PrpD family protein, partial [Thermoanaerobaculia bacterium]